MIDTSVRDYLGRDQPIRTADDLNQLIARLERHRDGLADAMLGADRAAAIKAEKDSDYIEDIYLPELQKEIARVTGLLESGHAEARRRAKALAIRERSKAS
jgi:ABC-type transporter Mla subunit MlaD